MNVENTILNTTSYSGAELEAPPFFTSPDEVILRIFNYLAIPDLGRAALVCTRFSRIYQEPSFWLNKAIELEVIDPHSTMNSLEQVKSKIKISFAMVDIKARKISFMEKKERQIEEKEYLSTVKEAMKYLPKDSYVRMFDFPVSDDHALIYFNNERKKVETFNFFAGMAGWTEEVALKVTQIEKDKKSVTLENYPFHNIEDW